MIHTLGLQSGVAVTFHDGHSHHNLYQHPRTLIAMDGVARQNCTHCILPGEYDMVEGEQVQREVRYVLTTRNVPNANLPPDSSAHE